jgi:hypothetical protein
MFAIGQFVSRAINMRRLTCPAIAMIVESDVQFSAS